MTDRTRKTPLRLPKAPSPTRMATAGASLVSFASMVVAMGPLTATSANTDTPPTPVADAAQDTGTTPTAPEVVIEVIPNYVSADGKPLTPEQLAFLDGSDVNQAVPDQTIPDQNALQPSNGTAPTAAPTQSPKTSASPAITAAPAPGATPTAPPATAAPATPAAPPATATPAPAPAPTAAPVTAPPATAAPATTAPPVAPPQTKAS